MAASTEIPNYEQQFADRFSAKDEVYQEYVQRGPDLPPIVEDWRGRSVGNHRGRDNRYPEHRVYRGRDRGQPSDSQQWQERRWCHNHQPRRYNAYNAFNPRHRNDRY